MVDDDDDDRDWIEARAAAREDVHRALRPRGRTCPSCGHLETEARRDCSACGAELVQRGSQRRRVRRRTVVLVTGAVVLGGLATAQIVSGLRRDAATSAEREQQRHAKLVAAEHRRLVEQGRAHQIAAPPRAAGVSPAEHRRRLIERAEAEITADAKARIRAGTLRGPVKETLCEIHPPTAERRAQEADLGHARRRYECIAFADRFDLPELEGKKRKGVLGSPFWAVIDDRAGTIAWCRISPRAGEGGGSQLAQVPVPDACQR